MKSKILIDSLLLTEEKFINDSYIAKFDVNFNKHVTKFLNKKCFSIITNRKKDFLTSSSH